MPPAEDLDIDWLGGYWKLPEANMGCKRLRDRIISAAKTGTAPVALSHFSEICAVLGDSMQHLFGGAEPIPEEMMGWYEPELAAYLIARVGVSLMRSSKRVNHALGIAQSVVSEAEDGPVRRCVESFVQRSYGVCEAKMQSTVDGWKSAQAYFQRSVELMPTNANTLYLLGMAALELERCEEAVDLINRSVLLDPDGKAPYVNLGVAYIRLRRFRSAVQISEAGLSRHPQAAGCHYHIGVAQYQLAMEMQPKLPPPEGEVLDDEMEYKEMLRSALNAFTEARSSDDASKRKRGGTESPWLKVDTEMITALEAASSQRLLPVAPIELSPTSGWSYINWKV